MREQLLERTRIGASNPSNTERLESSVTGALAEALRPIEPERTERIKSRLLERVRAATGFVTIAPGADRWQLMWPGVEVKVLHDHGDAQSFLVRMAAGAVLPGHAHDSEELCVVLEGRVLLGGIEAGPGTYHLALDGSRHRDITSPTGCLLFLRADLDHGIRFG